MRALDRRAIRRNTVHFGTTLYPVPAGALVVFAEREQDGTATGAIARLLEAAVERLAPGAWVRAAMAATALPATATPDDRAVAAAEVIRAALK